MHSSLRRIGTTTFRTMPARSLTLLHHHKPPHKWAHKAPQVQAGRAGGRVHQALRVQAGDRAQVVGRVPRAQVDRVVAQAHKQLDQAALKCSTSEEAEAEGHHHRRATAISALCSRARSTKITI